MCFRWQGEEGIKRPRELFVECSTWLKRRGWRNYLAHYRINGKLFQLGWAKRFRLVAFERIEKDERIWLRRPLE